MNTPPVAWNEAMATPAFYPWRDAYGREHPDIPRCVWFTRPRGSWSRRSVRDCQRKCVVTHGSYAGREAWFCRLHDPARRDERRVAELRLCSWSFCGRRRSPAACEEVCRVAAANGGRAGNGGGPPWRVAEPGRSTAVTAMSGSER